MSSLLASLAHWRPFRVMVVGDFMLDQTISGDADRLSPDAPVPVLQVRRTEDAPGGAANVCLDLIALKAEVFAAGVTGSDEEGARISRMLSEQGVHVDGLLIDETRPTTVKRSVVGLAQHRHPQKMFRIDVESCEPIQGDLLDKLLAHLEESISGIDVICIEDYDKGVCSPMLCAAVIRMCRSAGVPVLVDPASIDDFNRYRGATLLTPNRTEAENASRVRLGADPLADDHAALLRSLCEELDLDAVVVTLDRHGALLIERGQTQPVHAPTLSRQVYDVTGAGDMVLAALAACCANEIPWVEAVRFANVAAGLEVEIFGVRPIPLERIHHALLMEGRRLNGKRRTLEQAVLEVEALRSQGARIVFTNGCFDVLHAGHVSLLRRAAALGDMLIVGLNSDASVRMLKGDDRPVHAQDDRAEVLSELESIAAVVVFDEQTPIRLIEALRPDVLVKGADYSTGEVVGAELVRSWGGRVELLPLLEGRSSTSAIARLGAAPERKAQATKT